MTKTARTSLIVLTLFVALPAVGLAVAKWSIEDGTDSFRSDPIEHEVARRAYSMAWVHRDNPIQRLLSPAGRVVAVTQAPGHCASKPGLLNDRAIREYTALVRFYTFFGYPAGDVYLSCGGTAASSRKPLGWPSLGVG